MGVEEILQSLINSGVRLSSNGKNLRAEPREILTDSMRILIRTHKNDLHAYLSSEANREAFEERAAIMEFDGGLSRLAAEAAARAVIN